MAVDPLSLAVIGGGLVSGLAGSRSARRAGEIQAQAAREAAQSQLTATRESNELIRQMYERNLGLQAPQYRTGQLALSALSSGLGLGPVQAGPLAQPGAQTGPQAQLYTNAQGQTVDAAGNVVAAMPGITPTQMGATQQELAAAAQPFAGRLTETFRPSDLTTDPSYQFRLSEGLRALQARGAATGMLQTGQGMKDIVNYGQQAASQEYQSAYDRFMRNQEALYGRLRDLAGVGTEAATRAGEAGMRAGETIGRTTTEGARIAGELTTGAAAARAAGQVGSTQAITGAGQAGLQDWMTLQYLNRMPEVARTPNMPGVERLQPIPAGSALTRTIG